MGCEPATSARPSAPASSPHAALPPRALSPARQSGSPPPHVRDANPAPAPRLQPTAPSTPRADARPRPRPPFAPRAPSSRSPRRAAPSVPAPETHPHSLLLRYSYPQYKRDLRVEALRSRILAVQNKVRFYALKRGTDRAGGRCGGLNAWLQQKLRQRWPTAAKWNLVRPKQKFLGDMPRARFYDLDFSPWNEQPRMVEYRNHDTHINALGI